MAKERKYYAYILESNHKSGICEYWADCEKIVKGRSARYRGFKTKKDAQDWLQGGAVYNAKLKKPQPKLKPGIYFDAGTGRGDGVEIKVTDEKGKSLLSEVLPKKDITKFQTHKIKGAGITNNFGELLACYYALAIAIEKKKKNLFGDSRLIIDYWSKWRIKRKNLPAKTVDLSEKASQLREEFEKRGGELKHISGDHNPADLGFHR